MIDYTKYKAPAQVVKLSPRGLGPRPTTFRQPNEWSSIVAYLMSPECMQVRKNICVSCGSAKLFDAKGKEYKINARVHDLQAVKDCIAVIKTIKVEPIK